MEIVDGYFLILGAGKFGKKALEYAVKKEFQVVVILDEDKQKLLDIELKYTLTKLNSVTNLFGEFESLISNPASVKSNLYGLNGSLDSIFQSFDSYLPEWTVPVIPMHIFAAYAKFAARSLGKELQSPSNQVMERILHQIPNNVILNLDYNFGVITLSYAPENSECPDNCLGPLNFCPVHKIEKPKTITEIIQEISINNIGLINFNLESKQLEGGLGGIRGINIKEKILMLENIMTDTRKEPSILLVSTTCNCHGVINLFALS